MWAMKALLWSSIFRPKYLDIGIGIQIGIKSVSQSVLDLVSESVSKWFNHCFDLSIKHKNKTPPFGAVSREGVGYKSSSITTSLH